MVRAIARATVEQSRGSKQVTDAINRISEVNRVVAELGVHVPVGEMRVRPAGLTAARLRRLRKADAIVREEIGRDAFLLACWGIRPELIGLVDRH